MFPILCFAFFVQNLKIEYDPHIFGSRKVFENWSVVCLDTLWIKNFDEITLSHTVKEIQGGILLSCRRIDEMVCKLSSGQGRPSKKCIFGHVISLIGENVIAAYS